MTLVEQVRQQLQHLDNYTLQEQFRESPRTTASIVDGSLLAQYNKRRDEFLTKNAEATLANKLTTYDGENFQLPEIPIPVDQLHERRKEVQTKLQTTARNVQRDWDQLQEDYKLLQQRKEDLRKMLEEFEGDGDSLDLGMDEDDEEVVEEEDLQEQQDRLAALQKRKKELLSKLHRLQEEHNATEMESSEMEQNWSVAAYDSEAIQEIEKENEKLRETIDSSQQMSGYFHTMRLVTEELAGIRILSVEEGEKGEDVVLTIEILHSHQVKIGLEADARKKEGLRVAHAKLLTNPKVRIATTDDSAQTIELPIPVLDDLVGLAQSLPRNKALAFVIQETVSRIELIHERAEELYGLVEKKLYRMEKCEEATNEFGRCDHEVVFTLPDYNVKAHVRMTPDCPRLPGSVFLYDIKGQSDDVNLNGILAETRKTMYQRPDDLLEDVTKMLGNLQKVGRL